MLADHLGSGDYTITRVVFVGLLILAVVVASVSLVAGRGWTRVIGGAVAAVLGFAALRTLSRWEQVAGAVDLMTGPAGGELRVSEVDDVAHAVFGHGAVLLLVIALLAMLGAVVIAGRRRAAAVSP